MLVLVNTMRFVLVLDFVGASVQIATSQTQGIRFCTNLSVLRGSLSRLAKRITEGNVESIARSLPQFPVQSRWSSLLFIKVVD